MPWKLIFCLVTALTIAPCTAAQTDQDYLNSAQDSLDKNDPASSVIHLKNALKLNPDNAQARWLLGKIQLEHNHDPVAAQKELEIAQSLGVSPDRVLPYLTEALLQQRKYSQILILNSGGLSNKSSARVLMHRATAQRSLNEPEAALVSIEQSLALEPDASDALSEKAAILIMLQRPMEAKASLQHALAIQPEHAASLNLLGDLARSDKDLDAALDAYDRAIIKEPNSVPYRLKRVLVLLDQREFKRAQDDLDILKKQLPKYFEVNYAQGLLYFKQGKYEQALRPLEIAVAESEGFLPALFYLGASYFYHGGRLEQASVYASKFVREKPESNAGRKLLAQIRDAQGNFAAVEELLEPVVRSQDTDIKSINLLAKALMEQNRFDEAIPLFHASLSLAIQSNSFTDSIALLEGAAQQEPNSAEVHTLLGTLLLLEKDLSNGIEQLELAIKLDPAVEKPYKVLIFQHLAQKDFKQALKTAKRYRDNLPELAGPYNMVGTIHLQRENRLYAKEAFERARAISPGDITANQGIAALAIEEKDYNTATGAFSEILAHHPDDLDTRMKFAALNERAKQWAEMADNLQEAITSHPGAIKPRLAMARYHLSTNQPQLVPELLAPALQKHPKNPQLLLLLAQAQLASGTLTDARETLAELTTIQPESAEAQRLLTEINAKLAVPNPHKPAPHAANKAQAEQSTAEAQ